MYIEFSFQKVINPKLFVLITPTFTCLCRDQSLPSLSIPWPQRKLLLDDRHSTRRWIRQDHKSKSEVRVDAWQSYSAKRVWEENLNHKHMWYMVARFCQHSIILISIIRYVILFYTHARISLVYFYFCSILSHICLCPFWSWVVIVSWI